ncbi:hypothetical protein VroAM7_15890 [Vibrio rotiferianus]|uniref:Uncharacterized protein n=1 Tax=Vibrio rotiferianus TaxID=190895 RepID=A0A510I950_9VIBR|nr:hypothetical protein VroAM7_15890 [Vibrio rotiferianus]
MTNKAKEMVCDAQELPFDALQMRPPIITYHLISYALDILHYAPVRVFITISLCITKWGRWGIVVSRTEYVE